MSIFVFPLFFSTRPPAFAISCGITVTVIQAGGGDYARIQDAVSGVPATLTGDYCIAVAGGATYNEQVFVTSRTSNGFVIYIGAAGGASPPAISPPAGSTAAFRIENASVSVGGFDIVPAASIPYGIKASSAYATLSGVNVVDPGGRIYAAGMMVSSWSVVTISSITVRNAVALYVAGSSNFVAYSTASNEAGDFAAVHLDAASRNSLTGVYAASVNGTGLRLGAGSSYNSVDLSTTSINTGGAGQSSVLFTGLSSSNTITRSVLAATSGRGAHFDSGSYNTIDLSSMSASVSAGLSALALYFSGTQASYNTVSRSYVSNGSGMNTVFDGGSFANTILQSTVASNSASYPAVYLLSSDSNTVSRSRILNPGGDAALLEAGADFNTISLSTMIGAGGAFHALWINGSDSNTVTQSHMSNPSGYAAFLQTGADFNTISLSTMICGTSSQALYINASDSNTVGRSYMSGPLGYGATLANGSDYNTISLSTMSSGLFGGIALRVIASDFNTVTQSHMWASNGNGASFETGSDYNAVSFSTVAVDGAGREALYLSGSSSNTVTRSSLSGRLGTGAFLTNSSNFNTIGLSTMTGGGVGEYAIFLLNSDYNTVTQSYASDPSGYGAYFWGDADFNTISLSTVIGGRGYDALRIDGSITPSASNTVTRSIISNPAGIAANFLAGANGNVISLSSITSADSVGLSLYSASSNTVVDSYIQGSTAAFIMASSGTVLGFNIFVATGILGHAVWFTTGNMNLAMSSNTLFGGMQGAGLYLGNGNKGLINIATNTIRGSRYGVYIATQTAQTAVWLTSNTIVSTVTANNDTYGIYLNGLTSGATIQNNAVVFRSAGGTGANTAYAVYARSARGLVIQRNRISNPGMVVSGRYTAAYFSDVDNSSFTFNDVNSTATAGLAAFYQLDIANGSNYLAVKNNVFLSSITAAGGGSTATIRVDAGSQANFYSSYNDYFSSASLAGSNNVQWGSSGCALPAWTGAGCPAFDALSIAAHPRWFDPGAGVEDFHPLSQAGRYHPDTGLFTPVDTVTSQTIDKAEPSPPQDYSLEQAPNGSRANQGSYGNTPEASMTASPYSLPPGCDSAVNVVKDGTGDYLTIQEAVDFLQPNPLTGATCVVIRDTQTYIERVTVQNFNNQNNQLVIMGDSIYSSTAVVVNPPALSTAAFRVMNASVTIRNLVVRSTSSVPYGVAITSAYVTLSSVNVDSGGKIYAAGVLASSWGVITASSITVQAAHGLYLAGSTVTAVSYSTAYANSDSFYAIFLGAASSNTFTRVLADNPSGGSTYLGNGSSFNTFRLSTMTSNGSNFFGFFLDSGSSNTIRQSYISNPSGYGLGIAAAGLNNTVIQSTMNCDSGSRFAFLLRGSSNTVTQSFIAVTNGAFGGRIIDSGYNTVSFSTFIHTGSNSTLYLSNASSSTIDRNYIQSGNIAVEMAAGSRYNTISQSTMSSGGTGALYINGSSSNTVTRSLMVNTGGYGAYIYSGSYANTITQSTMTATGGAAPIGLGIVTGSSSNTITGCYIRGSGGSLGAVGVYLSGADHNTIAQSTMTSGTPGSVALYVAAAASNTVTRSIISNPAGIAANFLAGANGNVISLSSITSADSVGLSLYSASSNTVVDSYIQGSTAAFIMASSGTVLGFNTFVATGVLGHAVWLASGSVNLSMSSNTLFGGMQGAGLYLGNDNKGLINIASNTIRGSRYGVYIATQTAQTAVWLTSNTIVSTVTADNDSYGIYVNGLRSGANIQNNAVVFRSAGGTGANTAYAIYARSARVLVIERNRLNNPGMVVSGRYTAAYFSDVDNSSFTFNDVNSTATAGLDAFYQLDIADGSNYLAVKNNVFLSSITAAGGGSTATIRVDAGSQANFYSSYNDYFSSASLAGSNNVQWGSSGCEFPAWTGAGCPAFDALSIAAHPRWFDPGAGVEDFHPLSQAGRYDPATQGFVPDASDSATIDRGDPAEPFALEPAPNGSRANQGSYGNTPQASASPAAAEFPNISGYAAFISSIAVDWDPLTVLPLGFRLDTSTAPDFTGTVLSSGAASGSATRLVVSGLGPNTTYYARVGALYAGVTNFSGAVSTVTLAAAPAPLSFTGIAPNRFTLNWSSAANPGGTFYEAVISTSIDFTTPAGLASTTSFAATFASLAPNATYYARVRAFNAGGAPSEYALGAVLTAAGVITISANRLPAVWYNTVSAVFNAQGAESYRYSVTGNPGDAPTPADPTFDGSALTVTLPQGVAYFHVLGLDGSGAPIGTAHFGPVHSDSGTPVIPGVSAQVSATNPAPIPDGGGTPATTPRFHWTPAASTSPIVGYSYLVTTDPAAQPPAVVNTTLGFVDYALGQPGLYYFKVRAENLAGTWGPPIGMSFTASFVPVADAISVRKNLFNPLRGECVKFDVGVTSPGRVKIELYTALGERVSLVSDRDVPPGTYSHSWCGRNASNEVVASGGYVVHVEAPNQKKNLKVIVLK